MRKHVCFVGILFGLAAWLAGCVTQRGSTASGESEDRTPAYVRVIRPFEVRTKAGRPYTRPFLGGFNVPRPQVVDVEGDGDLDLFVQEVSGQVMFFERTATSADSGLVWRTDHFKGLDVGEWYRFADLDQDGDVDLLAEERFSYVRYYRNEGDATFTLAVDTLKDASGEPIFSDRQNIPNVTDIDCDDQLDLFLGRLDGTITRYESVGMGDDGVPRFQFVEDNFEDIEIIGQIGSMHGANTLTFADIDDDGDQDLFWGDFFEPSLLFIENTGTCSNPVLRDEPMPFPGSNPLSTSGYNAPTFGDWDADQDVDLFVGVLGGAYNPNLTTAENLYAYDRQSDGTFTLQSRRFLDEIDIGSESIPTFADLDGDGDQDLVLANKLDPEETRSSRAYVFENQGTPQQPSFQLVDTLRLQPSYHYAPAPGDLDADGDLDLLVGTWNKDVWLYRNEGSPSEPRFEAEGGPFVELSRGSNSTPALVDIDADGDLDLFVGESSGTINFYRNEGTPEAPNFVLVSDAYGDIDVGRRSYPVFVDLDNDGDWDLVVGTEVGKLKVFRNTGTPQNPSFAPDTSFALPALPELSTPAFVDIDADGDLDLFSGGIGGGLIYFENRRMGE